MQNTTIFEPLVLTGLYTTISLKVGTKEVDWKFFERNKEF